METSSFAFESSNTDDTAGRVTSETAGRRHSCDGVDMDPHAVSETDYEEDGERGRQQFVIPRRKDSSSSGEAPQCPPPTEGRVIDFLFDGQSCCSARTLPVETGKRSSRLCWSQ